MAPYEKAEEEFNVESAAAILRDIVNIRAAPLLLETALIVIFTIQTTLFVYHRWSVSEGKQQIAPHRRRRLNVTLTLSISMYFLALVYWLLDIIIAREELLAYLPARLSQTHDESAYSTLDKMLGVHWYVQTVLQILIWTSSDAVVLWRAYAVLGRPRWLRITIVILFLLEIGVYMDYLVFYLYVLPHPPPFIQSIREMTGSRYIITAPYLAAASSTLITQVFATALIAYKAWRVWKSRKGLFQGPGRVFRALAVLIESGVAYTLLWIWYTIATNDGILGPIVTGWTDYYLMPLTAMYPTLVVMIVTLQDSVLANVEGSPSASTTPFHAAERTEDQSADDTKGA
ncbi:unnamed protein product [Peniophora sp. CBMAI 1063]|nr:unnamed protein product [Peniophora sp. CBMAI 1063]